MTLHRLAHYEILERLGEGERFVYRAADPRRGTDVVLKILPAWMSQDPANLVRFRREVQVEEVLDHPNLVTLFTVGTATVDDPELVGPASDPAGQAEVSFMVMEYVEGEDLRQRLRRGPLSYQETLDIMTQVLSGLRAMHAVGVIHRNLNPGNIRITPQGHVKLLDFRLAKLITSKPTRSRDSERFHTDSGEVLGTIPYVAPEQFHGFEADRKSDLYSLGVLLYEMLSGRVPFPYKDLLDYFHALESENPTPLGELLPGIPSRLESLVHRLLATDPAQRYPAVDPLLEDLIAVGKLLSPTGTG